MPKTCCVRGCTARYASNKGLAFFRFPSKKSKPMKWNLWVQRVRRHDVAIVEAIARLPGHAVATFCKKRGADWEPNVHHRVCGRHFITGRPNPNPDHPDFVPSQNMGPEPAHSSPTSFAKRAADEGGCVKIKAEEDYDQIMIEEHLSCEDDVTGGHQKRDSGRLPTSSSIKTHKDMEEQRESSSEITQESDSQQCYRAKGSVQKVIFGADQIQTLGQILAYCQVMYGAIQKLDEKFEQLQAKVTNIQPVQLTTELFQKATSETQPLSISTDVPVVSVEASSVLDPTMSMPQLVRVCSPPPPASVEVKKPPSLSPAPRVSSPPGLLTQGGQVDPQASSVVTTHTTHTLHPIPIERAVDKPVQQNKSYAACGDAAKTSLTINTGAETLRWLGNKKRNVCISQAKLLKAQKLSKPSRAVRFLARCVFSAEEMRCSNTLGDPARGLKKLDPNKLAAIREWLARHFPEYDLREKGKDWRNCMSVMNSTARYLRLMAKRQQLKMEGGGETMAPQDTEDSHTEPDPEPEMEQPTEQYTADAQDHTEGYTAEIDVELSDSEVEDAADTKKRTKIEDESSLLSCSEIQYEYLGNPQRQVMVPQYAIYAALQRTRPELVVRVLIKYMFPEEVLVASNVYGNSESGIRPLDHNKITALREHLQERFPWLMLEEDGHDWKVCVGAINSTIRKFRHDLKMGRGRKKGL
ncbi:hypothetical protein ACEWY4_014200 [Coilia grayii]|uniref:BEN domain-containing protein n=1 Tax=Coilia grayii TaxID=363190 RepID=A0ABD1JRL7_9TELE